METDGGLPVDAECVFRGAATPASGKGPALCLDPASIFYGNSISCNITSKAYVIHYIHYSLHETTAPVRGKKLCFKSSVYVISVT